MLVQAVFVAPWLLDLYGPSGLLQGGLDTYILTPLLPTFLDWPSWAQALNLQPDLVIKAFFGIYVSGLVSLLVGHFMGLWSFALVMIALTGSLYLLSAESRRFGYHTHT